MPRKKGTKERFTAISIEQSLLDQIHQRKFPGEPLYQTAHRMFHKYNESEIEDAHIMMEEYRRSSENWKNKYMELSKERNKLDSIERFI